MTKDFEDLEKELKKVGNDTDQEKKILKKIHDLESYGDY